jgi:hypothetical protein
MNSSMSFFQLPVVLLLVRIEFIAGMHNRTELEEFPAPHETASSSRSLLLWFVPSC